MVDNDILASIIQRYDNTAKEAFAEYALMMAHAGRTETGQMDITAMTNGVMRGSIQSAAGRLGAKLTAAGKRAARETLFAALEVARNDGVDVTPTVALHAAERVIGRGVSMRAANKAFGQPGRTAADKSVVNQEELEALEMRTGREIQRLKQALMCVRDHHRNRWHESLQRAALINEWRTALGSKPMGSLQNV